MDLTRNLLYKLQRNPLKCQTRTTLDRFMVLVENQLPMKRFHGGRAAQCEPTECTVCLHDFKEGEEIKELIKCKHAFHKDCLNRWLQHHEGAALCPLCRSPALPEEVMVEFWRREQELYSEEEEELLDWHLSFRARN